MIRTGFGRRSLRLLLGAVMIASSIGVAGAHQASAATVGVSAFEGTATLGSGFPCNGGAIQAPIPPVSYGCLNGTFSGTAVGATTSGNPPCVLCSMTSNYTYTESCPTSQGAPPIGGAGGTFSTSNGDGGAFAWLRVGLTAIVVIRWNDGTLGASAAVFVPWAPVTSPSLPGSCSAPNTGTQLATVVGVSV